MYKILLNNSERFLSLLFNFKFLTDLKINLGNKSIELACLSFQENNILYILEKHNPYGLHPLRSGYMQHVLLNYNMDITSSKLVVIVEDVLGSSIIYSVGSNSLNNVMSETEITSQDVSAILLNESNYEYGIQVLKDQNDII